jgi:3'(2'), 5'-bisphosphate nucleotidase
MSTPDLVHLLTPALGAAVRAGGPILEVYRSELQVEYKADRSPLTLADTRSHAVIMQGLAGTGIPVLSEEGKDLPFAERGSWRRLWVVDPLDGTKEFVKRLGEFTVNIALVEDGRPTLGVVFVPVTDRLYFGAVGEGAWRVDDPDTVQALREPAIETDPAALLARVRASARRLPLDVSAHVPFVIVGSRSHATAELQEFVEAKRRELGAVEFISAGSSLKYCLVAEGAADVYPRLGPTMEWDTAAGQAIVEAAGARLVRWDTGEPMTYNKPDLLNPWHIVHRKPPAGEKRPA